MKKKILSLLGIFLVITALYFAFNNITRQTKKNYKEISYNDIVSKKKQHADFILFIKKEGCIHCENIEPLVNELAKKKDIDVLAITANREKKQKLLINNLKFSLYPTIIFFKKGVEEARIVGEFDKPELYKKIGELNYETK
jgi:thiol-disulfide isomerase/thioredoxin